MYDFLPVLIFRFFFSSNHLNYRLPYCIQLYTWSTQQVIVTQHICWSIWRLPVQSSLHASNSTGILNTCTRLWLTESEQAIPVDSIKDVVRSSVKVPEFGKHLKKAGEHIGRNVVEITIKMKTIVRKPLMIKINKLRLRNLDNPFNWVQTIVILACKQISSDSFKNKITYKL